MHGYQHRPFWWDGAEDRLLATADPAEALPEKTDVLIAGAGYSGMSAGLTLARAGRDVVVVDAGMPGFGCSARNGGLIGPSFHKLGLAGLSAAFGDAKAHAMLRESMDSLDWLKSFLTTERIDCGLHLTGRFRGATAPAKYDDIARECEGLARAVGLRFDMVARSEQHREIGSDWYHGGVVYPDDGHLHPGLFAAGLSERLREAGARIYAPARLQGIRRDGDGFTLNVAGRQLSAREVIIATNGYTGPELPYWRRRVLPLRSAIVATDPLAPETMKGLLANNRGFGSSTRLVLYGRPSPDGRRLIFGGRAFDLSDRPKRYVPDLLRLMGRIFPQLSGVGVSHAWSGTVAYSFDHAPHLGRHDGIHYVMGFCGSGVGRSAYYGNKLALQMLGHPDGRTELDGLDFPTRPFYNGTPWFLPAVLRWHSLMDRLGR